MVIHGRVRNGVVVLEGGLTLPEGTQVTVVCSAAPSGEPAPQKRRVQLPLVPSNRPGTLQLTVERIAELLDQEDFIPDAPEKQDV
ncbi:MAG TPA: hypothetical protein VHY91_16265 [Pirellulales bacterium]|jgi:hypothetical protein|nr:hypothetical protein [Pirellulales bacterium]